MGMESGKEASPKGHLAVPPRLSWAVMLRLQVRGGVKPDVVAVRARVARLRRAGAEGGRYSWRSAALVMQRGLRLQIYYCLGAANQRSPASRPARHICQGAQYQRQVVPHVKTSATALRPPAHFFARPASSPRPSRTAANAHHQQHSVSSPLPAPAVSVTVPICSPPSLRPAHSCCTLHSPDTAPRKARSSPTSGSLRRPSSSPQPKNRTDSGEIRSRWRPHACRMTPTTDNSHPWMVL